MSRYSEEFKRDAVALYENNEDLSLKSASAELGINQAPLHTWGKSTAPANAPERKLYTIKPTWRLTPNASDS
ncbi:transposase [Corynebacterium pseudodiphtheriticum]|uniref:transposase n=1 Tax=Corynebacterium pseudodiphtheriticum TaxID=37637 RepID=UPI00253FF032|nr:transposase [Corynebacterium pseudodiphtheriticum]MDK4286057.1 transposase [Corynebacterium pseudodiphtheriticum]MDK4288545.1 transposase [Corynebacterium pseudodiphtheriticum]MDK4316308.1 transposase [Corynebacterium pseudodiphtheriticum]